MDDAVGDWQREQNYARGAGPTNPPFIGAGGASSRSIGFTISDQAHFIAFEARDVRELFASSQALYQEMLNGSCCRLRISRFLRCGMHRPAKNSTAKPH